MIDNLITVFVPTSPIPSHPDTSIIERVLASIRFHLPQARIIIMADGVRPQVEYRRTQYEEYKKNLKSVLWKYGSKATMVDFPEYTQQAKMLKDCILHRSVITPLALFVEHDTYFPTDWNPRDEDGKTYPEDCTIEWNEIADAILSEQVNMVRFYAWEKIWHEHAYMMCGDLIHKGTRFVKTHQYSQWPNIASTKFYLRILSEFFHPNQKTMIEPVMVSPATTHTWEDLKIAIYHPQPNARRFYHLNARVGADGHKDPADW